MNNESQIGSASTLEALKGRITPAERSALENGGEGLVISRYNRATLLRMLALDGCPGGQRPDPGSFGALESALRAYLERYMPDRPQGHKWIILSCLFLACVVREPMHPQEIVGWRRAGGGYICPAREASEDSLCRWCVCRGEA